MKDSLSKDAAHSDFWRASPQGMMFLVRGYEEDSEAARLKPGTILDLVLPIWRIAECLLHAERLARELKAELVSVVFCVKWSGLSGRVLRSWANRSRQLFDGYVSRQDSVIMTTVMPASDILAVLPETVNKITEPLYEAFNFFKPPTSMAEEELKKMGWRRP